MARIRRTSLDKLWAEVIKLRDNYTCQRCGKKYKPGDRGLDAAHVVSRRYRATRYLPANGVALCTGCHLFLHARPDEFRRWFEAKYPFKYSFLLEATKWKPKRLDDERRILEETRQVLKEGKVS